MSTIPIKKKVILDNNNSTNYYLKDKESQNIIIL